MKEFSLFKLKKKLKKKKECRGGTGWLSGEE